MPRFWLLITFTFFLTGLLYCQNDTSPVLQDQAAFNQARIKAGKGDVKAQYELGTYYIYGYGVEQDSTTGYDLIHKAADKGYADAQNMWGEYCTPRTEDGTYDEALSWWRKAAAQGQPDAQYSIGQLYQFGMSVPKSDSVAFYWFRKAADQGLSDAILEVSSAYGDGRGVTQDYKEAYFWILLAFPGSWDAGYDSIEIPAAQLTDAERKAVEARATKWIVKHKIK